MSDLIVEFFALSMRERFLIYTGLIICFALIIPFGGHLLAKKNPEMRVLGTVVLLAPVYGFLYVLYTAVFPLAKVGVQMMAVLLAIFHLLTALTTTIQGESVHSAPKEGESR